MERKKIALIDGLLDAGLVSDGELLRYRSNQGELMLVGLARHGGIEVAGCSDLLTYTAFEAQAGSRYRRPAQHIHTVSGQTLQEAMLQAGRLSGAQAPEQETEGPHDRTCLFSGRQDPDLRCSACPAACCSECLDLPPAAPGDPWLCPLCVRLQGEHASGRGAKVHLLPLASASSLIPAGYLGAEPLAITDAVHGEEDLRGSYATAIPQPDACQDEGDADRVVKEADTRPGTCCFDALRAAAGTPAPRLDAAAAEGEGAPQRAPKKARRPGRVKGDAGAPTPRGGAASASDLRRTAAAPVPEEGAPDPSTALRRLCLAGAVPVGALADGRPLTLTLLSCAAVAAVGTGRADAGAADGAAGRRPPSAPATVPRHDAEASRALLSAARLVLRGAAGPLLDSRSGCDLLDALLAGEAMPGARPGHAGDLSAYHVAALRAGTTVVAAAALRALGPLALEVPLLAVRRELRRQGLAALMIAALRVAAGSAGARRVVVPALGPAGDVLVTGAAEGGVKVESAAGSADAQDPRLHPALAARGFDFAEAPLLAALGAHNMLRVPGLRWACCAVPGPPGPGRVEEGPRDQAHAVARLAWRVEVDPATTYFHERGEAGVVQE
uniref:PHD-type domain-containing protein n=1 Tax=Auxenochlorella protothecoides TaxID=3075 RepID=A0A1D1ZM43_AUXPR